MMLSRTLRTMELRDLLLFTKSYKPDGAWSRRPFIWRMESDSRYFAYRPSQDRLDRFRGYVIALAEYEAQCYHDANTTQRRTVTV